MKEEEYMRVNNFVQGGQLAMPMAVMKKRVVWNNSTLRQDYGKNYVIVPKYDGFCTVPNHLNHQRRSGVSEPLRADRA